MNIKRVDFSKGKWDKNEWTPVKSARWDYVGEFEEMDDHIVNKCPNVSDEELYNKYVTDIYASMVLKEKINQKAEISSTMSFDHLMAPLIVIAPKLGSAKNGYPEYREHHEIVLYNEGINIWHYTFDNGPKWHLAAFCVLRLHQRSAIL